MNVHLSNGGLDTPVAADIPYPLWYDAKVIE
jgi:hypothetical protein